MIFEGKTERRRKWQKLEIREDTLGILAGRVDGRGGVFELTCKGFVMDSVSFVNNLIPSLRMSHDCDITSFYL
jgi:hypothetical protein